jgi:hypothetical protein
MPSDKVSKQRLSLGMKSDDGRLRRMASFLRSPPRSPSQITSEESVALEDPPLVNSLEVH